MLRSQRLLAFAFATALALVVGFTALAVAATRGQAVTSDWVGHTHQVIAALDAVRADLARAESACARFLLAREEEQRGVGEAALRDTDEDVAAVRALTRDNAAQQRRLDDVAPVLARLASITRVTFERGEHDVAAGGLGCGDGEGRAVEVVLDAMTAEEERLVVERMSRARERRSRSVIVLVASGAVSALILVVAFGRLGSEARARAAMEDVLRASELRFRSLVEGVKEYAIFLVSPDGIVETWTPSAERVTGFRAADILQQPLARLFPADAQDAAAEELREAVEKGRVEREGWRARKDGSRFWASVVLTALRDPDGRLRGFSKVLRDVTDRKRAEDLVRASLEEKETLLKEIHHRVKNNLQVISSLLNLQARQIKSAEALEALRESQGRVRSIALVHEKLYQSPELARIDMQEYLQELTTMLVRTYAGGLGAVDVRARADRLRLSIDAAVPCGLIVNELVTNAFKHAFRADAARKEVAVEMRRADGAIELTVRDNGVGLPDGLDVEATRSMGMQLVRSLSKQLGGDVRFTRDGGTRCAVTFPAPSEAPTLEVAP